jgi:myosin heavy subunit
MQEELAVLRVDNARLTQQLAVRRGGPVNPGLPVAPADAKKLPDLGAQLEAARKDLAAALKANDDLTSRGKKLSDEGEALKRQIADRGDTAQRLRVAESELAEAQSAIEQLKKDNAALQAHGAELTGRLTQAAPVASPSPAPAATPADAGGADELARLKDELNRANSKVEMTVRSFALLREENERLKTQLAQTRTP